MNRLFASGLEPELASEKFIYLVTMRSKEYRDYLRMTICPKCWYNPQDNHSLAIFEYTSRYGHKSHLDHDKAHCSEPWYPKPQVWGRRS